MTPAGAGSGGYSLGMRQRLGIAAALLADPPLLILDEPANGLDPEGIRWMRELLRGHADRGGTVLLSSHLLGEVEHTVDRLVVIGSGRIVADGPIGSLLAGDGVRVRADDPAALADVAACGRAVRLGLAGRRSTVAGATTAAGRPDRRRRRPRAHRPAARRPRARGPLLPADRLIPHHSPCRGEPEMTAVMDRPPPPPAAPARSPTAARR